jgi:hypothetical protein
MFMKKIVSLLALLGAFGAANAQSFPLCVSFAPAGFCDAMQYDSATSATWKNYDCGGSAGAQTKADYSRGKTVCKAAKGCNPSAAYGWDALKWKFKFAQNTGTLTGISGGVPTVLQQDMPIAVAAGACTINEVKSGVSSLAH